MNPSNCRHNKGHHQVFIRAFDTVVVVILIALLPDVIAIHPSASIWIGFGMEKYAENICRTSMPVPSARRLTRKHSNHFLFSILFLFEIPTLVSSARVRSSPGELGNRTLPFQTHFCTYKSSPLSPITML